MVSARDRHVLAFVAVGVMLIAGCTSGRGPGPAALPGLASAAPSLIVTVVNDELVPLAAAGVRLDPSGMEASTAADGTARFFDLEPGTYRIEAEAPGHRSAGQSVDVVSGETTEAVVLLNVLPIVEPYSTLTIQSGMSHCTIVFVGFYVLLGDACAPTGVMAKEEWSVEFGEGWNFTTLELSSAMDGWWGMLIDHYCPPGTGCARLEPIQGVVTGPSPLAMRAFAGQVAIGKDPDPNIHEPFPSGVGNLSQWGAWAGYFGEYTNGTFCEVYRQYLYPQAVCRGVGFAIERRFTVYNTIFYFEAPADFMGYTAVPDQ